MGALSHAQFCPNGHEECCGWVAHHNARTPGAEGRKTIEVTGLASVDAYPVAARVCHGGIGTGHGVYRMARSGRRFVARGSPWVMSRNLGNPDVEKDVRSPFRGNTFYWVWHGAVRRVHGRRTNAGQNRARCQI